MRRALIAKIKIAQKELGLDDLTYRAVLERVTGKRSCTECSIPELERVVEDLRQHGFTPKKTAGRRPNRRSSADPMMRKIEALLLDNGWSWNYAHGTAKRCLRLIVWNGCPTAICTSWWRRCRLRRTAVRKGLCDV